MRFSLFVGKSGAPLPVPKLPAEETFTWWVYQHQEPLVLPSLEDESQFAATVRFLKGIGIQSICTLPLTTMHRRLGSLTLGAIELVSW